MTLSDPGDGRIEPAPAGFADLAVFKVSPTGSTSWWRVSFAEGAADEPVATWYEIAPDGKAQRSVDVMTDGRLVGDAVERYPSGVTPSGFGSLLGSSFFDLDWSWPDAGEDDPISPAAAAQREFAAIWAAAIPRSLND